MAAARDFLLVRKRVRLVSIFPLVDLIVKNARQEKLAQQLVPPFAMIVSQGHSNRKVDKPFVTLVRLDFISRVHMLQAVSLVARG